MKRFIILFLCLTLRLFSCQTEPSFHVLIASVGRESLLKMLKSLQPQLKEQDYLTVVFDGQDRDRVFNKTAHYLAKFSCSCLLIMETKNLGYWGHGIRNKYQQLPGDFVLHADDDDIYTSDAFKTLRKTCQDRETLYIFKIMSSDGYTLWINKEIRLGEIGTTMGAIPSQYNPLSCWGLFYGGDFYFYHHLQDHVKHVEFVDRVIYLIRPESAL